MRITLWQWIKAHPLQAAGRCLWSIASAGLFGASGAILAGGPWNSSLFGSWLAGIVGGLVGSGLCVWQTWSMLAGKKALAKRIGLGLTSFPLLLLPLALAAVFQLQSLNMLGSPGQDRLANFERLWQAMDQLYPYFELKGVDWQEVHTRYLPRIRAAKDDSAYFLAIRDMLAELKDGHTSLESPFPTVLTFGSTRLVDGQGVVVQPGPTAARAGIYGGDILLEINHKPLEQAYQSWDPRFWEGPTPWNARELAYRYLLLVPADGSLQVTYKNADGDVKTAVLQKTQATTGDGIGAGGEDPPIVSGKLLPYGVGYIRLPQFYNQGGHDLVKEFDTVLNGMMDSPGVIIDLRGNGGGNSLISDAIAGRFLEEPFTYGREYYRRPILAHGWRTYTDMRVSPRGQCYTGKLALITDAASFSTTEWFIAALSDSGRARTVGQRTGGGSGNPITFVLPGGGRVRFSTGDFIRSNGLRIEGKGIEPDFPVRATIQDFRERRDVELLAAEKLVQEK